MVNGYDNGGFGGNDSITREQMVLILCNYAKLKGYDVSAGGDLSGYTDTESVSSWAKEQRGRASGKRMPGPSEPL